MILVNGFFPCLRHIRAPRQVSLEKKSSPQKIGQVQSISILEHDFTNLYIRGGYYRYIIYRSSWPYHSYPMTLELLYNSTVIPLYHSEWWLN